jgi:hypothetical protein
MQIATTPSPHTLAPSGHDVGAQTEVYVFTEVRD